MMRRLKKFSFILLTLVGITLLLEAISYLVLFALEGRGFSYQRLAADQRDIIRQLSVVDQSAEPDRPGIPVNDITGGREVLHPYLGYVFNPELNERENRRQRGELEITAQGFFRSPEESDERATSDDLTIGIFGGSVAMLFCFQGRERLLERLAEHPEWQGKRIGVRCLALGGYKQPQQLLTLTYFLALGEKLDVAINLDGFNELALSWYDNYQNGISPVYPRAWRQRVKDVPDRNFQLLVGRLAILRDLRLWTAQRFAAAPARWSVTAELIWRLLDRGLAGAAIRADRKASAFVPASGSYEAQGPYRPFATDDLFFAAQVEMWQRSSRQMHRLCRTNGIEYLHALQPNQYVPGSKPMSRSERELAIDPDNVYRHPTEQGYPQLVAAGRLLREEGIRFTDLSQAFSGIEEPLYVDSCCHFSERGNEILAEAIAAALVGPASQPS